MSVPLLRSSVAGVDVDARIASLIDAQRGDLIDRVVDILRPGIGRAIDAQFRAVWNGPLEQRIDERIDLAFRRGVALRLAAYRLLVQWNACQVLEGLGRRIAELIGRDLFVPLN